VELHWFGVKAGTSDQQSAVGWRRFKDGLKSWKKPELGIPE
jgi:hypothetical protein